MNINPKISILIATYNAESTLDKCINSIISQNFRDLEIIVIDGFSTDNTVEIIRKYSSDISYWHSRKDNGIYDAWNQAISMARGEYICFIGSDDYFARPGSLLKIMAQLGSKKYDLITSRGIFISRDGSSHKIGAPYNWKKIGRRMLICHPGMLHHRRLFETYGNFDTQYKIAGDLEFLTRLPKETTSMDVDEETVVISDGGISRSRILVRLAEQRKILSKLKRYGIIKAWLIWIDRLWRFPVSQYLGLPY